MFLGDQGVSLFLAMSKATKAKEKGQGLSGAGAFRGKSLFYVISDPLWAISCIYFGFFISM